MLYKKKTFSLPATEGKGDCSQGHAMLDKRGKCIRCGESAVVLHPVSEDRFREILGLEPWEATPDGGFEVRNAR